MSRPRVGFSSTRSSGSALIFRPRRILCALPRERGERGVGAGGADVEAIDHSAGALGHLLPTQDATTRAGAFERDVFGEVERKNDGVAMPIFGHEADAVGQSQRSRCDGASSGECEQDLVMTRSFDADYAEDFAGADRKGELCLPSRILPLPSAQAQDDMVGDKYGFADRDGVWRRRFGEGGEIG